MPRMIHNTAVVFEGSNMTYGALMRCSSRTAVRLQQKGAKADAVVGLCVEKSFEEVAGMVGIMRAGAV